MSERCAAQLARDLILTPPTPEADVGSSPCAIWSAVLLIFQIYC